MLNNLFGSKGKTQLMSDFLKTQKEQLVDKFNEPTTAEVKYRQSRKKKKRLVQASKRANRR